MGKLKELIRDLLLDRKTWLVLSSVGIVYVNGMLPEGHAWGAEELALAIAGLASALVYVFWRKPGKAKPTPDEFAGLLAPLIKLLYRLIAKPKNGEKTDDQNPRNPTGDNFPPGA